MDFSYQDILIFREAYRKLSKTDQKKRNTFFGVQIYCVLEKKENQVRIKSKSLKKESRIIGTKFKKGNQKYIELCIQNAKTTYKEVRFHTDFFKYVRDSFPEEKRKDIPVSGNLGKAKEHHKFLSNICRYFKQLNRTNDSTQSTSNTSNRNRDNGDTNITGNKRKLDVDEEEEEDGEEEEEEILGDDIPPSALKKRKVDEGLLEITINSYTLGEILRLHQELSHQEGYSRDKDAKTELEGLLKNYSIEIVNKVIEKILFDTKSPDHLKRSMNFVLPRSLLKNRDLGDHDCQIIDVVNASAKSLSEVHKIGFVCKEMDSSANGAKFEENKTFVHLSADYKELFVLNCLIINEVILRGRIVKGKEIGLQLCYYAFKDEKVPFAETLLTILMKTKSKYSRMLCAIRGDSEKKEEKRKKKKKKKKRLKGVSDEIKKEIQSYIFHPSIQEYVLSKKKQIVSIDFIEQLLKKPYIFHTTNNLAIFEILKKKSKYDQVVKNIKRRILDLVTDIRSSLQELFEFKYVIFLNDDVSIQSVEAKIDRAGFEYQVREVESLDDIGVGFDDLAHDDDYNDEDDDDNKVMYEISISATDEDTCTVIGVMSFQEMAGSIKIIANRKIRKDGVSEKKGYVGKMKFPFRIAEDTVRETFSNYLHVFDLKGSDNNEREFILETEEIVGEELKALLARNNIYLTELSDVIEID